MYIPNYDSALFLLGDVKVVTDYLIYISETLHRKHYGKTKKYRR